MGVERLGALSSATEPSGGRGIGRDASVRLRGGKQGAVPCTSCNR